jgi:hypothetical protein
MTEIKRLVYLRTDGRLNRTQNGDITNIGGTSNGTFTVGGRGLLFDDGSSTAGGHGSTSNLQGAYNNLVDNSSDANVHLNPNQDLIFTSVDNHTFKVDANNGNITLTGLLNGINFQSVIDHLNYSLAPKHAATEVTITPIATLPNANNVQEALQQLSDWQANDVNVDVQGYEHIQLSAAIVWHISHLKNSKRIQWSLWDENDESILPDSVKIINSNSIQVNFNTPQAGRIILMTF